MVMVLIYVDSGILLRDAGRGAVQDLRWLDVDLFGDQFLALMILQLFLYLEVDSGFFFFGFGLAAVAALGLEDFVFGGHVEFGPLGCLTCGAGFTLGMALISGDCVLHEIARSSRIDGTLLHALLWGNCEEFALLG